MTKPLKTNKRLLALLFALSLGMGTAWAYDFSAVCETGQTLYYNITDATNHYVSLTCPSNYWSGYTKPAGDIILPATVEYDGVIYTVTSIGNNAFRNCDELTGHLAIPNTVIYIYTGAFRNCSNITELTIGEGVTYIWGYAFWYCSQLQTVHFNAVNCTSMYTDTSDGVGYSNEYYYSVFGKESTPIINLTIGPKVTQIPNYAFKNCTSVCGELVLPSSLSYIGSNTFSNCSFTSIILFSKTPPSTSSNAFYRMNYGIPVIVPEGSVSNYQGASGWNIFTNYQSFPNIIASICSTGQTLYFRIDSDNRALLSYPGNSISNPWPETYDKPTGFVVIPDSVECANYPGASYSVSLSVIGIDPYAMYSCDGLTQVTIPEGIITVGDYAFWNCPALQTVFFNAINCTYMQSGGQSVFSPNLTRVVIGNSVQRIPAYAFYGSVDLYQRLVIPASVTEIGTAAFHGCNSLVQMIIQGDGLLTIGGGAFYGCSALRNALVLPNSVISVGSYAFYGCSMLPSVTIGTSTTTIGDYAFWNCPALTTINYNATNCISMNTDSEYSVFGSTTPISTLNIGENVTRIPDFAFRNSPNINGGLVFPSALTSIGQYAFSSCSGYSGDLVIPNTVNSIGQSSFEDCYGFNGSLTLPNNDLFLAINNNTFSGCNGLTGSLVIQIQ